MLKNLKKRNEGFTIIEVLIVLAIAGLILLIIFLAVPALQRNSRNTQRKNDVQAILGGVSEFESNNSGATPTGYNAGPPNQLKGAAGTTPATIKAGYYTGAAAITVTAPTLPNNQAALTTDVVRVVVGEECAAGGATTSVNAGARQIAAQYMIESNGGLTAVCQDS